MWRHVVAQAALRICVVVRRWLAKFSDFADQQINLLLLANHDLVELLEKVFAKAGFDFQLIQAMLNKLQIIVVAAGSGVFGGVGVFHAPIGHELAASLDATVGADGSSARRLKLPDDV